MEKDALLEIIIHDLKEVEMMAENAKGDKQLSKAYFKLTRNRINSILDELEMLEELSLPVAGTQVTENAKIPEQSAPTKQMPITNQKEGEEQNKPADIDTKETTPKKISEEKTSAEKEIPSPNQPIPEKKFKQESPVSDITGEKTSTKEEIPVTHPQSKKKENQVLGEKLITEKSSFNEQIGKHQKNTYPQRSYSAPPIADLKKAMGINDRFFFQRELFGGSADVMNQTLEQLNEMQGISEAQNFLLANFNWNPENEAVLSFMELVERRYL